MLLRRNFHARFRTAAIAAMGVVVTMALVFVGLASEIVVYSTKASTESAQAAVVLGAAAWGSHPSPVYRERLNEAIRLYKQGRVETLIFTGGTRNTGFPSEAQVARDYALKQGIPNSRILVDTKSHSTFENLLQAKELMTRAGIQSALIVSDPLHMKRAMLIADELNINAKPSPTESSRFHSWTSRGKFLWHETLAYAEHLLVKSMREN